ncbi:DUF1641 domain-containing protein [Draconibacterium sediminis]|uniref:DUF1641 domain-containing protein n=1 Tax=Draconibacterium sediminis TaxID=1544798 RepID=A0A0D8JCU9_9BACT|nr:DUF1641 domain-containing protein [Draconibacterium sediminis]KJF44539.1 hypothetical protein LH29_03400 [Draconibacterium sediminis]
MEEKSLQVQISELNQKVDLLLEYVNQQRLKTNEVEDLISDLSIVGKDMYDTAVEDLDNRMVHLDIDEVKGLMLRILRNIDNMNRFLELFESMNDLVKDASPILNEVIIDFSKKLNELDQKGYFEFFVEAGQIFDNIITHYKPSDVKELADNIVTIMETVRSATQPEMMSAMNNGLKIYGSMEMENVPEYSIFKVMREMNQPEMKRALGFFVTFMKNMAAETNKNNN